MHAFKDINGRTWTIQVNVFTIKQVRAHCHINLLDVMDINQGSDGLLSRIAEDPVLLAEILYAICIPDYEKTAEKESDFLCALAGDSVEQASMALLEEIADFFPKAKGALLRKVLEVARAQEKKSAETLEEILKSQELETDLQKIMSSSSPSPTNSVESSESIQEDLPSGN